LPPKKLYRTSFQLRAFARVALPIVIIIAAAALSVGLLKTPPEVPRAEPENLAAVVGVVDLVAQDPLVHVDAFGTVVAARQTRIHPELTGRISWLHPNLIPGGHVAKDEVLFEIESSDYTIRVAEAEATVSVARLLVEGFRANVNTLTKQVEQVSAELEFLRWNVERLGRLSESEQAGESEMREARSAYHSRLATLAALEAQVVEQRLSVDRATAEVRVAESRLAAAELALSRTRVRAPFDAIVLEESVEVGQLINPQTVVATLAATDEFWIEAAVPVSRLSSIRFAEKNPDDASSVVVAVATGEGTVSMEGVALRSLGRLDPEGRMARILISVHDPLKLDGTSDADERGTLLLGSYVRLQIDAGRFNGVFTIPRYALRENSRVWVRDASGTLAIRQVEVLWRRQEDVLVRDAFLPGDRLITTHLSSVVPGMPLIVRENGFETLSKTSEGKALDEL
jgi:RND family efflux transporter MFP subunit